MRGLKSLVIGMGVLIVIGLTVVIITVVKRYNDPESKNSVKVPNTVSVPVAVGFGEKRLSIPKGAKILETVLSGERLVITLQLSGGDQAILLINSTTGKRTGLIRLAPQ